MWEQADQAMEYSQQVANWQISQIAKYKDKYESVCESNQSMALHKS